MIRDALRRGLTVLLFIQIAGCSVSAADEPLAVFAAGSLARPLKAALDSFSVATNIRYSLETAGSLELARRITDLGRMPDVIALADEEVFVKLLMPVPVEWYARFARNRVVLAVSPRSAAGGSLTRDNWARTIATAGLVIGRADPDLDPAGYRALMVAQLAEQSYGVSGISSYLLSSASARHVRPKSADLIALLEVGELDAAFIYESSARAAGLSFILLGDRVDLSADSLAEAYQAASVTIAGQRRGDSVVVHATPIRYGISVPRDAAKQAEAMTFVRWLFSPDGLRILRSEYLDAMSDPVAVGDNAPALR